MSKIPIQPMLEVSRGALKQVVGDVRDTVIEENIQARIRGVLLMAYSNANPGTLVITTGNKSEIATGYFTLYGDSVGAFAPLRDIWKTQVYQLARFVNERAGRAIIPNVIIEKAPSAELRPGEQKDSDHLLPYPILDELLDLHIHRFMGQEEILATGFAQKHNVAPEEIMRMLMLVRNSNYKRRQLPPGGRDSAISFGENRRMPDVNHFDFR